MELPPFPVDDWALDLIDAALNPGPEAERTSLIELLELLSELGGADPRAVESVERIGGLPGIAEDLIEDDPGAYEIHYMRDPQYHEHDVIRALMAEVRRLRGEIDGRG